MKVSDLRAKVESFRQGMYQYFQLWNRSFDESDDDYPTHNTEELERQRSQLARQLGGLRPYMNAIGLPTDVRWYGQSFDVYHCAVSNDLPIRKAKSIEFILPALEQALGRLEGLNPNSEVEMHKESTPPQHVTIHQHGAQSRVNLNSTDNSTNTLLSQTDQSVFTQVRAALQHVPDGRRRDILSKLADFEAAAHRDGSHGKYKAFIESAKDFMSILGPFVPMLTQMLK